MSTRSLALNTPKNAASAAAAAAKEKMQKKILNYGLKLLNQGK